MDNNKEITSKEIRGITARNLISIFSGFGVVIITVMTTYYNIMRKLDTVNIIQTNIISIESQIQNNSQDIKAIKQQDLPTLNNRISVIEEEIKDKIFYKDIH